MLGRAVFTSFTIGMGGSGGVFAPTLFIGAMAAPPSETSSLPCRILPSVCSPWWAWELPSRVPRAPDDGGPHHRGDDRPVLADPADDARGRDCDGASRFLTRATIYTEKLRRRGDVLDDPVEGTLLGTRAASEWMTEAPETLPCEASAASAIATLRRTKETVLPVVDEERHFVGLVSSLRLAELTQRMAPWTHPCRICLSSTRPWQPPLPRRRFSGRCGARACSLCRSWMVIDESSAGCPSGTWWIACTAISAARSMPARKRRGARVCRSAERPASGSGPRPSPRGGCAGRDPTPAVTRARIRPR